MKSPLRRISNFLNIVHYGLNLQILEYGFLSEEQTKPLKVTFRCPKSTNIHWVRIIFLIQEGRNRSIHLLDLYRKYLEISIRLQETRRFTGGKMPFHQTMASFPPENEVNRIVFFLVESILHTTHMYHTTYSEFFRQLNVESGITKQCIIYLGRI